MARSAKANGFVGVVVEGSLAQAGFLAFLRIGHEEPEVFLEIERLAFDARLEQVPASLMGHPDEPSGPDELAIGFSEERHIELAALELHSAAAMVGGNVHHGAVRPHALPGTRGGTIPTRWRWSCPAASCSSVFGTSYRARPIVHPRVMRSRAPPS